MGEAYHQLRIIGLLTLVIVQWGCSDVQNVRRVLKPAVVHSAENKSPYSMLDGTTILIEPYGASFEIPASWLTPKPSLPDNRTKNLFLSWADLNEVDRIDREINGFDSEDADVINAVLPFEDCVAHVGDRGWGNGLWNDLQARIYITNLTPQEIETSIENKGLKTAAANFEEASLKTDKYRSWTKHSFKILDAPTHFLLFKSLDFYTRCENDLTVVFVFLHADSFEKEISMLLDSFRSHR